MCSQLKHFLWSRLARARTASSGSRAFFAAHKGSGKRKVNRFKVKSVRYVVIKVSFYRSSLVAEAVPHRAKDTPDAHKLTPFVLDD